MIVFLFIHTGINQHAQAEWSGGVEGGSVLSDGGSATRLRFKLTNLDRPFSQYVYIDWIRNAEGDNSYETGYKPRYWFTDQLYGFGEGKFRVDKKLQIDREILLLAGAGYQFFQTESNSLWAEAAVGQRDTRFDDRADTDDTFTLLRASFHQIFSDIVRFELDVNGLQGEKISEASAEAGVSLRVSGGALKYTYRVRNIQADGQPDIDTSDSFVSFSYGF